MSIVALLITLVVLFSLQGSVITELPAAVGMIAIGIFCNILLVFVLTYIASKFIHLSYEDAARDDRSKNTDITKGFLLLTLSVATSIDALAVGLSFASRSKYSAGQFNDWSSCLLGYRNWFPAREKSWEVDWETS